MAAGTLVLTMALQRNGPDPEQALERIRHLTVLCGGMVHALSTIKQTAIIEPCIDAIACQKTMPIPHFCNYNSIAVNDLSLRRACLVWRGEAILDPLYYT